MFTKTRTFFKEVSTELAKASWPWDPKLKGAAKYRELIDSTMVVIVAMVIVGAFVSLADFVHVFILEWAVRLVA